MSVCHGFPQSAGSEVMVEKAPESLLRSTEEANRFGTHAMMATHNSRRSTTSLKLGFQANTHTHTHTPAVELASVLLRCSLCSMRSRFEKLIRASQDSICAAIEDVDGTQFREDAWVRPNGGGGITRVLQVHRKCCRGIRA